MNKTRVLYAEKDVKTILEFAKHIIALSHKLKMPVQGICLSYVMLFSIRDYLVENGNWKKIRRFYNDPFRVLTFSVQVEDIYAKYIFYTSGIYEVSIPKKEGEYFNSLSFMDGYIVKYLVVSKRDVCNKHINLVTGYLRTKNIRVLDLEDIKELP